MPGVRLADGAAALPAVRLWYPAVSLPRTATSSADHGTLYTLAVSATGSARVAPHRRSGRRLWCICVGSLRVDLLDSYTILK